MSDSAVTAAADKKIMPANWPGELKVILGLGLPMAATQLVQFFVYTIDVIMIGRVSADALAASSLGLVVMFLIWMIGSGPVAAVTPLISQALGANQHDYDDVRLSVRMSLWVVSLMTPLIILGVMFTEPVLIFFGQDPVISKMAGEYVLMLSFGMPFALGVMCLRNFLAALNKTTIPLILVIISTALNAFFNYLLIFGNWGFPRLELIGAGIASSLVYFVSFLLFVAYVSLDREAKLFRLFKDFFSVNWARLKELVILGWPISVSTVFEGMLFNACVLLMGVIGKAEIAAYQIAMNVGALAFMLPWGLSMAGGVRAGLAAGARNHEAVKRVCVITILLCVATMATIAVCVSLMPNGIAALYLERNSETEIVFNYVVLFLPLAAAFMLSDAVQVASNQLLRSLKDVRAPMFMTGFCYWIVGFPVAWYLGLKTSVGPNGIWYGLLVSLTVASVLLGSRLYWLVWKTQRL
nr:multidrug transporter MatE [uncultured bacterium]